MINVYCWLIQFARATFVDVTRKAGRCHAPATSTFAGWALTLSNNWCLKYSCLSYPYDMLLYVVDKI